MKNSLLLLVMLFLTSIAFGQQETEISEAGIIFPRLTTDQRNALTPQIGQVIYNTTTKELDVYVGSGWTGIGEQVWAKNGTSAYYSGGNVGIGISSPVNPLSITASGSPNLVRVDAGDAPSGQDLIELIVSSAASTSAQFIEMQRGSQVVSSINTDGSAKFKSVQFEDNSIQTKAAIGPIAFGSIATSGSISSGTGNYTCAWVAADSRYEITITGESYHFSLYCAQVTPAHSSVRAMRTSSVSGKLIVYLYNSAGSNIQGNFHFTVFKP